MVLAGPALVLLDPAELARFGDLRLRLSVNGGERQNALVDGDMLYRPLQALQALTRFQHLSAGDLILDGWLIHEGDHATVPGVDVRAVPLLMTEPAVTAEMVRAGMELAGVAP